MSYDAVAARLTDLITGFLDAPESVLDDSVLADIERLWLLARPADPDSPTEEELRRSVFAQLTEGWLRFLRWQAGPNGRRAGDDEYDRSVVLLASFAEEPQLLPQTMAKVLGPDADEHLRLNIAIDLFERAHQSVEPAALEGCIVLFSAAVESAEGVPRSICANLANAHRLRFSRYGELDDLERAIELGERAVTGAPADDVHLERFLTDLAMARFNRFEVLDERHDIDKAIETGLRGISAPDPDPEVRAGCLTVLGGCFRARFERYQQDTADLDRALELATRAVATYRASHSLSALATVYETCFGHTRVEADIDKAIDFAAQAISVDPPDSGDRGRLLAKLSSAHRVRFTHSNIVTDLDQAVDAGERACAAGIDTLADEVFHRHHLGVAYRYRFQAAGVLTDLDRAIEEGEYVQANTPVGHADRGMYLASLGSGYRLRSDAVRGRAGSDRDLDRAIEIGEASLDATPSDHPQRPTRLTLLVDAYLRRGETTGDLDRAIALGRETVERTAGHFTLGSTLSNLGLIHQRRYAKSGDQADLVEAIRLAESAVGTVPREHAARTAAMANLALALRVWSTETGETVSLAKLTWLADELLAAERGLPAERLIACREVGVLALATGHPRIATKLLDAAIALLPATRPREGDWSDQTQRLRGQTGVVSAAVAAHCAANDPVGALQAAERGRGIILGARLDARSDLSALVAAEPELAREFDNIRSRLGAAEEGAGSSSTGADFTGQLRRLWEEYDEVLARIRERPTFQRFLMAPLVEEMFEATEGGVLVMVNAGADSGDAVIVTPGRQPVRVPLPGLNLAAVEVNAAELDHVTTTRYVSAHEPVLPKVLSWLWTAIVEPVLAHFEPSGPGDALPRVRWMPIGLLGLFPLHAAGPSDGPGALDAVVSSYTSTIRALAHARSRPVADTRRQLIVAVEHVEGLDDLPHAKREAVALRDVQPGSRELFDELATTENVLRELPKATWVHFACHATADHLTPSRTRLHLHDDVLSLTRLSQLELSAAEFAYLSACSTADRGLHGIEESLHLASAFQLAGFRHVVGSLWPLDDAIAARAAKAFYARLPADATADGAASALHEVSRALRDAYTTMPHLWAGLIHTG
ncbi:CHAT domain-containing protein [Amycolatopsis umgeniensis]|uniref:Tetratricopeptide (TPR) repeat protein n=1 Tax=Amycolatopsis umgeniensis TaxID=336628 RepID=A0A841AXT7_9PSEU|nr:CHAT domain-containing protein [Amycolatopsis umgeniensis]MBB5850918.1 tetratricopeptide (TPR) repeat protein [Amycolatopsis umgeniensis]